MNDEDLISELLEGGAEAVGEVRRWIRGAFVPYHGRLGPELDDLEQEVLLDLTRALGDGTFRSQCRLRTYVRTYVHHKAIDRLRALKRRDWVDVDELELVSRAPSALEELSRKQSVELALRVVEEMPETCRELWAMLEEGLRYQEMSRRLGVAEGTLRARVLRCRRRALEARDRIFSSNRGNETGGPTTE